MNTSAFFPHITLIGVGLIGGSFMLDLKRLGLVQTVTGIDTNADNLNYALECGIIDLPIRIFAPKASAMPIWF